ncbi:MAG: hypothetical protein A2Y89_06045 [Chloroflexi bacterium RBG_13_51_18]|nr:MAG: hypothetical protein A2Y89_06045 [Chloroflexi bacterium RBG_13_51_18]
MFKVKATVIGFDKDEKKYPCHFRYKIGEEIIYDGETITGRVCPSMAPVLGRAFNDLLASGGRHKEGEPPGSYFPFWHSPLSIYDPACKKYDGVGFRPTPERPEEDYKFIADETLFDTPPGGKYNIGQGTEKRAFSLVCGDKHTLARFKVEAFDLADKGDSLPYYRRGMSILNKIIIRPGIPVDNILGEFSTDEINNIYPILGQNIIAVLVGELELMGYVEVADGKANATEKGQQKLAAFKKSLTKEERKALKL